MTESLLGRRAAPKRRLYGNLLSLDNSRIVPHFRRDVNTFLQKSQKNYEISELLRRIRSAARTSRARSQSGESTVMSASSDIITLMNFSML